MDDDWDLHAVVRGCTAAPAATGDQVFDSGNQDFVFTSSSTLHFEDLFNPGSGCCYVEDLHELCKPFLPQSHETLQKQAPQQQKTQLCRASSFSSRTPATPRSKRRKNNSKRECVVSAENLPSDMWSWRKYGQKPIKGSPYPRGYYRCSTSKGCTARKQVEKNRSDPGMFIVTYTGEHNHRNPAPNLNLTAGGGTPHKKTEVSKSDEQSFKLARENLDEFADGEEDDDDGEFGVSKTELDDTFLTGLEELTVPNAVSGHELNLRL